MGPYKDSIAGRSSSDKWNLPLDGIFITSFLTRANLIKYHEFVLLLNVKSKLFLLPHRGHERTDKNVFHTSDF